MINEGSRARTVAAHIAAAAATATLERLEAPSVLAQHDVTLAGQSFGRSTATGVIAGTSRTRAVTPTAGAYVFRVPAGSAAMLIVPARSAAATG